VGPVLEEAAIRTTHLKDILCAMKKAGEVDFPQATARNKPKEGMIIRSITQAARSPAPGTRTNDE